MEKKSKKPATKKIKKYDKKFKLDMSFEDAIGKVVNQPPKNTHTKKK